MIYCIHNLILHHSSGESLSEIYAAGRMTSMRFTINGKNIEVTQGLRSAVESKIGKLERYFTQDTEAHVIDRKSVV